MVTHTVFYSWQSDLPNSINRGFIQDCLEKACKDLRLDEALNIDPCIDRDTTGVPGSPDIAATIFSKISAADLFVGDVTFVNGRDGRRIPNPNVLIELGFAASALDWDRIVCVFNSSYGSVGDLPFDLRPRRIIQYELNEADDRAETKRRLTSQLRTNIQAIIDAPNRAKREAISALLSKLAGELIPILIFGAEIEHRSLDPWLTSMRDDFNFRAKRLREIALSETAISIGLEPELDSLADLLGQAANLTMHSGAWEEFSSLVTRLVVKANEIKACHIDSKSLDQNSINELLTTLRGMRRQLDKLSARIDPLLDIESIEAIQNEASAIGYKISQCGHYNLDCIQSGLAERLRDLGQKLHLTETIEVYCDGGASVGAIFDRVHTGAFEFETVIEALR